MLVNSRRFAFERAALIDDPATTRGLSAMGWTASPRRSAVVAGPFN
jgi:hypothetical protein